MSRLASQEKGLYYPTPEPIIPIIAKYLSSTYPSGLPNQEIRFLDPCAGKGRAVAMLAEEYRQHIKSMYRYANVYPQVTTYGIEPNIARAKEAKKVLDETLLASFFQCHISCGDYPDGGFQCVFVNPPYDWDKEGKERLEITFLKRSTQKLCFNGVLIWVVPLWIIERGAEYLSRWYTSIKVFRLPDEDFATPEMIEAGQKAVPMFSMFNQVVVLAQKRSERPDPDMAQELVRIGRSKNPQEDITDISAPSERQRYYDSYTVPIAKSPLKYWSTNRFDPEEAAQLLATMNNDKPTTGVYSKQRYRDQHWPSNALRKLSIGNPLASLKNGHIAVMAVAGLINGAQIQGLDGRIVIVKGFSRKRKKTEVTEDEESIVTTVKDTFDTALWCIDMTPGDTLGKLIRIEAGTPSAVILTLPHESMSLGDFLRNFGPAMAAKLAENNPALYQSPDQVPWASDAFAQLKRQPRGRQHNFILSIVNAMVNHRMTRVGEIAEMSTGKTYLSLATMFLGDSYLHGCDLPKGSTPLHLSPALVMCPEIIAYKWAREAEDTIPGVKAIVVRRIDTDAKAKELRAFDPSWKSDRTSAVGCMRQVILRIQRELKVWQYLYDRAKRAGKPLPQKPAHVVIVPNNTAKLGMNWSPVYRLIPLRRVNAEGKVTIAHDEHDQPLLVPCCPECFTQIRDTARIEKVLKSDPEYQKRKAQLSRKLGKDAIVCDDDMAEMAGAFVSEEELWGTTATRKKRWCGKCGSALWQYTVNKEWAPKTVLRGDTADVLPLPATLENLPPTVKSTTSLRYPVSDYVKKFHPGFFKLLISDEIHQGGKGTALDFARRSLMGVCDHYLGLTGTLCNGYASSLFPFAWSVNSEVREQFHYDGVREWVDCYGARKVVTKQPKEGDEGDGAISKRKTGGRAAESELPAFNPAGLPSLFGRAGFLELFDVTSSLPRYSEDIEVIEMGQPLQEEYTEFERNITGQLAEMLVHGDKRALGSWFQCLRRYPNLPFEDCVCATKEGDLVLGRAAKLSADEIYPKEQRIIELVQRELDQGRRVIIYCESTGYYDIQSRYQRLIEENVKTHNAPNIAVLRAKSSKNGRGKDSPDTLDREAWLMRKVKEGCNVLICNSALVQVGLDLVDFHTILVPEIPTNTSQMRQAFRRIHRLGQTKETKIVMLVYPTMELRLLRLMSNKMKTSLMVEGQLPEQGLVSFGDGGEADSGDFQIAMAREIQASLKTNKNVADLMVEQEKLREHFASLEQAVSAQNDYIDAEEAIEEGGVNIIVFPLEPAIEPSIEPVVSIEDPWKALREKRDATKRTRSPKKEPMAVQTTLW